MVWFTSSGSEEAVARLAGEVLLLADSDRADMREEVRLGEVGRSTSPEPELLKGIAIPSRDLTVPSSLPVLLLLLAGLLAAAAVGQGNTAPPAMPNAQSADDNLLNLSARIALVYDPIRFNSNST